MERFPSLTLLPKLWGKLALFSAVATGEMLVLYLSIAVDKTWVACLNRTHKIPCSIYYLGIECLQCAIHSCMPSKIILKYPVWARFRHMGKEEKTETSISRSPGLGKI